MATDEHGWARMFGMEWETWDPLTCVRVGEVGYRRMFEEAKGSAENP